VFLHGGKVWKNWSMLLLSSGVRRRVVWYKYIEISERLTSSIKTLCTLLTKPGYSETSTPLYPPKKGVVPVKTLFILITTGRT